MLPQISALDYHLSGLNCILMPPTSDNFEGSRDSDRYVADGMPPREEAEASGGATPPAIPELVRLLEPICEAHGIHRLEVFGSVARGEAKPGSDVDLIAYFRKIPGYSYVGVIAEMKRALGVPVDLLIPEDVEENENVFRKALIQRDRRTIYVR